MGEPVDLDAAGGTLRRVDRVHCYAVGPGEARLAGPARAKDDAVTASVCLGRRCLPPAGTLEEFVEQFGSAD